MKIIDYIKAQIALIPEVAYIFALIALCVCAGFIMTNKGRKYSRKVLLDVFLLEYVIMILGATVFFRKASYQSGYNLTPFWSYQGKYYRDELFLPETIMNIGMFIPIGFFVCMVIKSNNWWKTMLIGATISSSIEILQFTFKKGFSELDDVFHNTVGCMVGIVLYRLMIKLINIMNYKQAKYEK